MPRWLLILIASVSLLIVIILNAVLNLFDVWSFFGVMFYITVFFGLVGWVVYEHNSRMIREEQERINKKSLNHCWQRINALLRAMPDGDSVEWSSGFGRKSELKSFTVNGKVKNYRSVLAHLVKGNQLVAIIYDIDEDDIVRYNANPSTEVIVNPFINFNPEKSGHTGSPFPDGRFDNRYNNRYGYGYGGYKQPFIPPMNNPGGSNDFASFDNLKPNEDDARKILEKSENG